MGFIEPSMIMCIGGKKVTLLVTEEAGFYHAVLHPNDACDALRDALPLRAHQLHVLVCQLLEARSFVEWLNAYLRPWKSLEPYESLRIFEGPDANVYVYELGGEYEYGIDIYANDKNFTRFFTAAFWTLKELDEMLFQSFTALAFLYGNAHT